MPSPRAATGPVAFVLGPSHTPGTAVLLPTVFGAQRMVIPAGARPGEKLILMP